MVYIFKSVLMCFNILLSQKEKATLLEVAFMFVFLLHQKRVFVLCFYLKSLAHNAMRRARCSEVVQDQIG